MSPHVSVEPVEELPGSARVCHYDELDEPSKERFPDWVRGRETAVPCDDASSIEECDVVKFTDYYRVRLHRGKSGAPD